MLNAWDFGKAIAIGLLLSWTARGARAPNLGAFGLLFLVIGIEDQLRFHSFAGRILGGFLRSVYMIEGGAETRIGEFIALLVMAAAGALLVWGWRRPARRSLRRARLVLSALLVALFMFAVVLNVMDGSWSLEELRIAEEVGERLVLTAAVAYAAGLSSVKDWRALP